MFGCTIENANLLTIKSAHLSHERPMQNEAVPHRGCITTSGRNGKGGACATRRGQDHPQESGSPTPGTFLLAARRDESAPSPSMPSALPPSLKTEVRKSNFLLIYSTIYADLGE